MAGRKGLYILCISEDDRHYTGYLVVGSSIISHSAETYRNLANKATRVTKKSNLTSKEK